MARGGYIPLKLRQFGGTDLTGNIIPRKLGTGIIILMKNILLSSKGEQNNMTKARTKFKFKIIKRLYSAVYSFRFDNIVKCFVGKNFAHCIVLRNEWIDKQYQLSK